MNESRCPVPKEQQPTNEFIELSKSTIFCWPKSIKSFLLTEKKNYLNIDNIKSGIYLIQIKDEKELIQTKKLILK